MAKAKVESFGTLYKRYIALLKAQGCVFCPTCYAYLDADHRHADVATLRKAA